MFWSLSHSTLRCTLRPKTTSATLWHNSEQKLYIYINLKQDEIIIANVTEQKGFHFPGASRFSSVRQQMCAWICFDEICPIYDPLSFILLFWFWLYEGSGSHHSWFVIVFYTKCHKSIFIIFINLFLKNFIKVSIATVSLIYRMLRFEY